MDEEYDVGLSMPLVLRHSLVEDIAKTLRTLPRLQKLRFLVDSYTEDVFIQRLGLDAPSYPLQGVLTSITTLSLAPDDGTFTGRAEAAVTGACPNLVTFKLDLRECHKPSTDVEAYQMLANSLVHLSKINTFKSLEIFKFGLAGYTCVDPHPIQHSPGWTTQDLEVIFSLVPEVSRLALYGNIDSQVKATELTAKLAEFPNLKTLGLTIENYVDREEFGDDYEDSDAEDILKGRREKYDERSRILASPYRVPAKDVAADVFRSCQQLERLWLVDKEIGHTFAAVSTESRVVEEIETFQNTAYAYHCVSTSKAELSNF